MKASGDLRRKTLLGLAHMGAKQLGMDDETRREAQVAHVGVASCAKMSDAQLLGWCWELKRLGAKIGIPGRRPMKKVPSLVYVNPCCQDLPKAVPPQGVVVLRVIQGGGAASIPVPPVELKPTDWQWVTIEKTALDVGFSEGLDDPGLREFARRTVGVSLEDLSRSHASDVILGLRRWLHHKRGR